MTGVHLRACKLPGAWPPYFTDVTPNQEQGFVPALMRLMSLNANFTVEWVPFDQTPFLTGQTSYIAHAFDLVAQGLCDLIISSADSPADYHAQHDEHIQVVPTQPFAQTSYSILVKKEKRASSAWQMFEPFETELWAAIIGTWLVIAMSIAVIQATQSCAGGPRQLILLAFRSLYYSGAALLGGDTNEWIRWPNKVVHVGVLVFTLVVLASYTASLTGFITQPSWVLVGPLSRAELQQQPVCATNAAQGVIVGALTGSADNAIVAPIELLIEGGPQLAMRWCADQVKLGSAAGIFVVDIEAAPFLESGGCEDVGYAPALKKFASSGLSFFVGRGAGHDAFAVATNLTRTMYTIEFQPEYYALLEEYGMQGYVCPDERSGESAVAPRIKVQHLSGLFVATFGVLGIAVFGALAELAFHRRRGSRAKFNKEVKGSSSRASEVQVEVAHTHTPIPPPHLEAAREQCSQLLLLLNRIDACAPALSAMEERDL